MSGTILCQLVIVYIPFLNPISKTQALTVGELAAALLLSFIVFIAVEIETLIKRLRISS